MPKVTLNTKRIKKLIGKDLSLEQLHDRISMIGTDLEHVNEKEILVEVFPNRPDWLSEQGFARSLATFIGTKKGISQFPVKDSKQKIIIDKSVADIRPYTVCAIIKGLTLNDETIREIMQIQEKLHVTHGRHRKRCAIGIYPLDKIHFPVTYTALSPKDISFVPLESKEKMAANEIISKHPAGKQYGHLLEGKSKYPVFIDSKKEILSMPPIINSHTVGKVTEKTKDVFIECSGTDYDSLSTCLNIIVTTLADMGGQIFSLKLEYGKETKETPNLDPRETLVSLDYVNKRLGLELTEKQMISYLEMMGYGYKNKKVLIPAYRADVIHPIDVVEDIAVAYGFEKFEPQIPNVSTIGAEDPLESFKRTLAHLLTGLSYLELNTYNIANRQHQQDWMNTKIPLVELANALNEEYNVMRAWLVPSLIDALRNNRQREYPQCVFEAGAVFEKGDSETGVVEPQKLAIAKAGEGSNYTEMRQVVEYLLDQLGVEYEFTAAEHPSFISGRCAQLIIDNKDLGIIGELHPQVISNWGLEVPVCVCELHLSLLFDQIK